MCSKINIAKCKSLHILQIGQKSLSRKLDENLQTVAIRTNQRILRTVVSFIAIDCVPVRNYRN